MCGIIGILSEENVTPRLIEGLSRLEYRGYDSAGIATLKDGQITRTRAKGKLQNLRQKLDEAPVTGTAGIGHTRWATHGGPTEDNAHPHATDKVAVVHNGIIENYAALKAELAKKQVRFETDTDTEVIAHLVDDFLKAGYSPKEAADATFEKLEGAYAIVMIFTGEENLMIGCRQGTPLAVGYGKSTRLKTTMLNAKSASPHKAAQQRAKAISVTSCLKKFMSNLLSLVTRSIHLSIRQRVKSQSHPPFWMRSKKRRASH